LDSMLIQIQLFTSARFRIRASQTNADACGSGFGSWSGFGVTKS
jgi:hypothetical protein